MERKKRIMSLPDYGPTNGSPDVILFMGDSYEKAGASKDVLTDSNTRVAAYSPTRVTNALAVSHCGYREAHEAPDIIQYEGASYVKADLDALEKLVGDLSGLYSRRINAQHRLVYEVVEEAQTIKILSMWSHYERL